MSLQAKTPILMSLTFLISIVASAAFGLHDWQPPALLWALGLVGSYLAWLFIESKVAMAETKMPSTGKDKGSLELYAFGRFLCVTVSLLFARTLSDRPDMDSALCQLWIGGALFIGAVAFRLHAIRTLGRFYSHRVRIQDSHTIIDVGPYRFIRHPAYTGMLLCHLGFVIAFYTHFALAVWLLVLLPSIVWRILIEEKALMELPQYAAFAATRKRLLPFVW